MPQNFFHFPAFGTSGYMTSIIVLPQLLSGSASVLLILNATVSLPSWDCLATPLPKFTLSLYVPMSLSAEISVVIAPTLVLCRLLR
jgi:hypothetical protein